MNTQSAKLFRLDGRIALVTGAGGHLGQAMATGLAEAGAHVILNGRNDEKLEKCHAELQSRGYAVSKLRFDICEENQVAQAMDEIKMLHGQLDILVNNAYAGKGATIETTEASQFAETYSVAVTAAFMLVKKAIPLLKVASEKNPAGASIINITSMYGQVSPDPSIYGDTGMNNPPFYGAAKGALMQLTRYLGVHLAPQKIRVNAISPGAFPGPLVTSAHPEFAKRLAAKAPLGRIGKPEDLQGAVVFLGSDASAYVTGINLPVDGGWTAW